MSPIFLTFGFLGGLTLLVAEALGGGSPPPDPAAADRAAPAGASAYPFDLTDPARINAGKRLFSSTCAEFCHGHAPPLFIGRQDLAPEYAFKMITDGGGTATPMPPWGQVFSKQEIWELVAYLKYLGTQKIK